MTRRAKQRPYSHLKSRFAKHHQKAVDAITKAHPVAAKVVDEVKGKMNQSEMVALQSVGSGFLAGALLLGAGNMNSQLPAPDQLPVNGLAETGQTSLSVNKKNHLVTMLMRVLPSSPRGLTESETRDVERILSGELGTKVRAALNGHRLNTIYGFMGAEQHLPRYPGDSVRSHDEYQQSGITSSPGSWGYFANSAKTLTKEDIQKEKYYFAVQTFLAPNWYSKVYELKDWFKHKKMVAVNPKTGDAVVGVIADAGPAVWTGKQFGGSPEVMGELHLNRGMRKGEVLLFFVDDPDDEVALGPINDISGLSTHIPEKFEDDWVR